MLSGMFIAILMGSWYYTYGYEITTHILGVIEIK